MTRNAIWLGRRTLHQRGRRGREGAVRYSSYLLTPSVKSPGGSQNWSSLVRTALRETRGGPFACRFSHVRPRQPVVPSTSEPDRKRCHANGATAHAESPPARGRRRIIGCLARGQKRGRGINICSQNCVLAWTRSECAL